MEVKAATVDGDGSIWVTGRLETTPGEVSTSQLMLVRFDPESLEVEELHYDSPESEPEFGLDLIATEDAVLIAGRARNTLGQYRATLWSYDGTEFSVVDSEAESFALDSHATYNSVTTDLVGQVYLGGSRDDADGVSAAMVRGGEVDAIDELFSYATSEGEDLNDQIRGVATDAEGNLWFVGYHSEDFSLLGSVSPMFTDWRLYTGPPTGPFEVVDSFHFSLSLPSYARSVAVHPSGVVFTSGVAMDSVGGTHLIVRAGNPPDMFTSLDSLRDAVPSLPTQGTYPRSTAFERDGTVWVIEGWQNADAVTETGEPIFNTRLWRMSCL
jgi:streptogramin lyase